MADSFTGAMPSDSTPAEHADSSKLTFEEAITQLEEIIERVEHGKVGIERAMSEYERGVKLVSRCKEILQTVEQRIEELAPRDSGAPGGGG